MNHDDVHLQKICTELDDQEICKVAVSHHTLTICRGIGNKIFSIDSLLEECLPTLHDNILSGKLVVIREEGLVWQIILEVLKSIDKNKLSRI